MLGLAGTSVTVTAASGAGVACARASPGRAVPAAAMTTAAAVQRGASRTSRRGRRSTSELLRDRQRQPEDGDRRLVPFARVVEQLELAPHAAGHLAAHGQAEAGAL